MDIKLIKKLIEDSFLTSDQKRFLVQYMELKGIDMKFFETLNTTLVEATKNRGKKYQETILKIKELEDTLDKRATVEKKRIEERLEQEIANIDPLDLKTKQRIWEEYYDTLDELGERYNNGLKDMVGKIVSSIV